MSAKFEQLESRTLMSASPSSIFPPGVTLPPILNAAGWRTVGKLDNDLNSLAKHGHITWAQIDGLEADGEAGLATVDSTPSVGSIAKLKADVKIAFFDRHLSAGDITNLTSDISAVLVSAGASTDGANTVAGDFGSLLGSSGLTSSDIRTIGNDFTATLATFRTVSHR